jgi:hypothetical protein
LQLLRLYYADTLYLQQTEKSGARFKFLKSSKQTLTPFPQQSTLFSHASLPERSDFIFGASFGLVSLQVFHGLDMLQMAKGDIQEPQTGKVWTSRQSLTSEDLIIIANSAKKVKKNGNVTLSTIEQKLLTSS